ncbi:MAG: hypothetical protein ACKVOJ_01225 [Sphingomonadaceae bacterium]
MMTDTSAPSAPTSRRATIFARIGQSLCLFIILTRGVFAVSLGSSRELMGNYIRGLEPNLPPLISMHTWIGFDLVLFFIDFGITAWVMMALFGLFGALGRGEIMGDGLERRLLHLCLAAAVGTFFAFVARSLYTLVAVLTGVPGPHGWGIALTQDNLLKALATILVWLFVMIVRELRRVDAENKSFI